MSDQEIMKQATGETAQTAVRRRPRQRVRNAVFNRRFTKPGVNPLDEVEWEDRNALISSDTGETVFEQRGVEMPVSWTQMATNIVVSKYFHGPLNSERREKSLKQLLTRVVKTIADWGRTDGYFIDPEEADTFEAELMHLCLHQKLAFNSPVWFNVGIEKRPQCSACFINSVEDSMDSILNLAKTEGMLFKWGSGTGTNLSPIRSSRERLATGGVASGPVSFMRGFDAFAGVIKSGGKTRRAAKMVILNSDHPDIREFIHCKANEEKKAWALIDAGYDAGIGGEAYGSVFYQNSNNSVRLTDDFMRAVLDDHEWVTRAVTDGHVMDRFRARDLWQEIASAAHLCGDPGLQFDTTINDWHTCPNSARINASNPCSEYMFIDDSACNLASLNLMRFTDDSGEFDIEGFRHAVRIAVLAQEIIVDNASYPNAAIRINSHNFRPLGLGYANLGALLMSRGIPYDSDAGRTYAAAITALLGGEAYYASSLIAERIGPFPAYEQNRVPFLRVMNKHRDAASRIDPTFIPKMWSEANRVWESVCDFGSRAGFRNSQVTVLAPTGTIGFMMDCDTTGVEPDIALVKYKKLVGGGVLKMVNNTVPQALQQLGYDAEDISSILEYIEENDTIEGADELRPEHYAVFDCAFRPRTGSRSIHYMGHVRMMAAVQPFVSGAISKTVNMPSDATVEDILRVYEQAWRLGLKAIAIYRDGCKRTQPLTTSLDASQKEKDLYKPRRRRLPDERKSITHKFSIAGVHEGYITVGMYEDGSPGEIFIVMAKEGSTISGLMDTIATMTSIMLQYGVPLEVLVNKFSHVRFEPAGFTKNPDLKIAKSIVDYVFRWLGMKFLKATESEPGEGEMVKGSAPDVPSVEQLSLELTREEREAMEKAEELFIGQEDAPTCPDCGALMIRNGSCYRCHECGTTSGCS